jgi:glutamate transport system ATP-binding protein
VTSSNGEPLVRLSGVNKWFGELHVLQDIDLEITRGEVVVVIGPSGSGKSTLCRTINRLESIEKGEIAIDGERLPEEGKELARLRSDVGMVFQSFNLFAHKTILQNVTLGPIKVRGTAKAEAEKRARELLERVGVSAQADKYPAQLSGGQQQRVAIARALAYQPEIMLMDEPFASVDAQTRGDLEDLVLRVQEKYGVTILFVTHDIDEAVYMADRVVVLTHAPTTVLEILPIGIPFPRDQIETKALPEFAQLRAHVYRLIKRDEAAAPAAAEEEIASAG